MELVVIDWINKTYSDDIDSIRDIDSHFWRGAVMMGFHLLIAWLIGLFILSYFLYWGIPFFIIAIWLIYEGIRAFGKLLEKR